MRKSKILLAVFGATILSAGLRVPALCGETTPEPSAAAIQKAEPAEVKAAEKTPEPAKAQDVAAPAAAGKPAEEKSTAPSAQGKDAQTPAPEKAAEGTTGAADAAKSGPTEEPKEAKGAARVSPTAPVAIVNGAVIPRAEYDRAFAAYMQNFRSMSGSMHSKVDDPNDTMKSEVVNQLVDREILYQESAKFPVEDLKAKVDEEMKSLQARFPNPETFQEALKAQSLTEKELQDLLGRQASVRHYVETQIAPKATVADEEIKKFYEENKERFVTPEQIKASHLLIRIPEGGKPEDEAFKKAKAKAEELQKKAAAGEDFEKLCKENSEDPGSAPQGGDLGYFTKDRMVEPFAAAAFALKVNQISDVVETRFGFHVIKVLDRKETVQHGFDEVKDDISAYLKGLALDKAVRGKVEELRKTAKIDVVSPHL